ncbi:MAG TPA: right-handed parallel beta-helix repeat-containing protein [Bryobacteraceae bacterium]|nr:right-handed parallel beta-helix repeat-containing protein [Bryobacteraceae bacterium]
MYLLFLVLLLLQSPDATVPGEVSAPYPTVTALALEWRIEGDANLNSVVKVSYRKSGEARWREGMPLRRVPAGSSSGTRPIFHWDNKHSGSIFDLEPGTSYEVRLILHDPDGGGATRTLSVRTRPVPRAPAGAKVRKANPATIGGARPGEIVVLEAGSYGRFAPEADGEPGRPIVYRSTDGKAVFESISLDGRKHVYLENLAIENPGGTAVSMVRAEDCVVRRCRIRATYGVRASKAPGAKNCYISDNIIDGPTPWTNEAMGASGKNIGEGIQLTGPGNVICFNRVTGFRDCISNMEEENVTEQISIDIYNNDIYVGADDAIEADFCFHNCRVMRNRITNSFVGLSSQPSLGGPTYFLRNVMYNLTYVPFKLHRGSRGDVIAHNTTVKAGDGMACFSGVPFDHAWFRNNLSIGGPSGGVRWGGYGGGSGMAAQINSHGPNSSFDYDAVGTYQTPFKATIGKLDFFEVEPHGVRVDMSVFDGVEFPVSPLTLMTPPDLRPRPGSPVVDAGLRIPGINDGFLGKAPDIGAYEAGQPLPWYGPRPDGIDEATTR